MWELGHSPLVCNVFSMGEKAVGCVRGLGEGSEVGEH